jgi:hypothetical protein
MSSGLTPAPQKTDAENRLIWRMNRKRLEAEEVRDAILAADGTLDRTMGGQDAAASPPVTNPASPAGGVDSRRRSVYLRIFRNQVPDFLRVLDFPDPHALLGQRYVTSAPTQALLFMNSDFIMSEARRWAEKLLAETGRNDPERLDAAWRQAYARPCAAAERDQALAFLARFDSGLARIEPDAGQRRVRAWAGLCQALIESTEFRFLD